MLLINGTQKTCIKKILVLTLDLCKGKASEFNEASHLHFLCDK